MRVITCASPDAVGRTAAECVAEVARRAGPEVVLGVATGSSPLSAYEHLAAMVRAGDLDLTRARAFALDEYVGLPRGHAQGYAAVVDRTVTRPLGLDPARVHVPDGCADDLDAAASAHERLIADAGGVDVQILGIGSDGHIGFNEPGASPASRTHVEVLAESTRRDNARFFASPDEVPHRALTEGLATILDHRCLVVIAQGLGKARAVADMIEGPVTTSCPASLLQRHPDVTVVLDAAAASCLRDAGATGTVGA